MTRATIDVGVDLGTTNSGIAVSLPARWRVTGIASAGTTYN